MSSDFVNERTVSQVVPESSLQLLSACGDEEHGEEEPLTGAADAAEAGRGRQVLLSTRARARG